MILAEWPPVGAELLALLVQVMRDFDYRIRNSFFLPRRTAGCGNRVGIGDLAGNAAIVEVQGVGRRQSLAQDVTLGVPGNVFRAEAETKAIGRTLGAEYFQLCVTQFRVHLNDGDAIASFIPRKHVCTPKN